MPTKAYLVHDGEPNDLAVLVFASNAHQARITGFGHDNVGCEGFIHVRAKRLPASDHLLDSGKPASYVEYRQKVLRSAGFAIEGDESCEVCGLFTFDGAFPVCGECGCCGECGHDEECSFLKEVS